MDSNLLLTFILLNVANVIIQTIKSIATIKCGKVVASLVNAVSYGLYTIVTVYTMCELPLGWKAGIVALCNLFGVYVVKWIEEKIHKDRLWKVECVVPKTNFETIQQFIDGGAVPGNYIEIGNHYIVNFYCANKTQSKIIKEFVNGHNAKYFVSESRNL